MINMGGDGKIDTRELNRIMNIDKLLIGNEKLFIHYPVGESHFVQVFCDPDGFTLRKILRAINKTGKNA